MMNWFERGEQVGMALVVGAVTAVVAGIGWLIRTVFTSQKKIEMLEHHLAARDKLRDEDREAIEDVREGVKRIESVLLTKGHR